MPRQVIAVGILTTVIVGVAACGSSSTSTDPVVNADVGVTSVKAMPLRLNEAPYLLVDRSDPNTVYLSAADLQQKVCRFYTSTDRGASWSVGAAPSLSPYTDCGLGSLQPQNLRTELAQGPTGTLYYAYQANNPAQVTTVGNPRSVLLGRSTDRGRTWSTTAIDASPAPATLADVQTNMEVHVTVDPANAQNVYAMWRRSYPRVKDVPSRATRSWMAISNDGGATFGAPFMMFDKGLGFDGPRPVVANGKLYAFYRLPAPPAAPAPATPAPATPTPPATATATASDATTTVGTTTTAATATATTTTTSATTTAATTTSATTSSTTTGPATAPPMTTLVATVSSDQGKTWQDSTIIASIDAGEPIPLYDSTRNTFDVVWMDNRRVNNGTGHLNVYFSTSKDAATWSNPVLINDDHPESNLTQHYYPQISLAPNGRLDVAWYDFRDDTYPAPTPRMSGAPLGLSGYGIGHAASVYTSASTDGGSTWSRNLKLNSVPIDRTKGTWNGEFFFVTPPTVTSGNDWTLAAWSDTRNGDVSNQSQDIYTGLVTYGSPSGAPASDNSGLVGILSGVGGALAGAGISLLIVGLLLRRRRERPLPTS